MNFRGANAIVTGGSSGIGKAAAKLLARRGANVFIIARDQQKLEGAVQEIEAERVSPAQRFGCFSADVRSYEEVAVAVAATVEAGGPPDLLINSAGITHPGYFEEIPLSVFRDMMDTNYFGALHAIKAVLPHMMARKSGWIVTISSVAGLIGVFGYTAYGASKFAVRGFSAALRAELKPHNIGVSVLLPPDTETPQLWEENKIKPYETKAISGNVKPMSPERVARELLRGIRRGKHLIIPGLESKLISRLQGLSSSLVDWYMDRLIAKAQAREPEGRG